MAKQRISFLEDQKLQIIHKNNPYQVKINEIIVSTPTTDSSKL
jgi:hypothetical protein